HSPVLFILVAVAEARVAKAVDREKPLRRHSPRALGALEGRREITTPRKPICSIPASAAHPWSARMERALKRLVWQRAHDHFEYCQLAQENHGLPFAIDHIVAHVHGGPTRAANLCLERADMMPPMIRGIDPIILRSAARPIQRS